MVSRHQIKRSADQLDLCDAARGIKNVRELCRRSPPFADRFWRLKITRHAGMPWQENRHGRAFTLLAIEPNLAAMQFRQGLDQGQADAGAQSHARDIAVD